jgi:hypothetical protein
MMILFIFAGAGLLGWRFRCPASSVPASPAVRAAFALKPAQNYGKSLQQLAFALTAVYSRIA